YYGYFTECFFGSVDTLKDIINNYPKTVCDKDIYSDALFYYANKPELGIELYNELRKEYTADCLLIIRDKLIIPNFQVIESIIHFTNESYYSNDIYTFLSEELEVGCPPNIVMSRVNGFDLSSNPNFYLTDGLVFEMIYTNACLI